jgi:porin
MVWTRDNHAQGDYREYEADLYKRRMRRRISRIGSSTGSGREVWALKIALGLAAILALGTPIARAQSALPIADTVATAFSYTGEVVGDVNGGAKRDVAYLDAAAAQFTITISKRHHVGWPGLQLYAFALGTHGGAPSDLAGDVQGVSNLQAPSRVRLEELWLQQNAFGNRASLLVGRYDLNSEYYRSQSTSLFVNSSFGIGPEFAQSGEEGPSIFPRTSVGARIAYKPSPNATWRVAVLDGVPIDRAHGESRIFARGDGALLVGEFAVVERPETGRLLHNPRFLVGRGFSRPYTGKLAIGAWYYTARFPDLVDTMATGAPVEHRGSGGVYAIADRIIWSAGQGSPASLSAFAQIGVGDSRVNQIGSYVGGGFTFVAPIASRAQDELGLGIAAARNGSHYQQLQATGARTYSETTVELTYLVQVSSWLAVQPDVQYVNHPGNARTARFAVVPGLRFALSH